MGFTDDRIVVVLSSAEPDDYSPGRAGRVGAAGRSGRPGVDRRGQRGGAGGAGRAGTPRFAATLSGRPRCGCRNSGRGAPGWDASSFTAGGNVRRMPTPLTADTIVTAPKVLLHDHLDGGLRPATLIDLARAHGYAACRRRTAAELARWFSESAYSGSLERYLETFMHTARGDADPGVAESGWPPSARRTWPPTAWSTPRSGSRRSCTLEQGLTLDEVVRAVLDGFAAGTRPRRAAAGTDPGRRSADRDAARRPVPGDRRAGRRASATTGSPGSTSPAPRPVSRPPGIWTRSSTCAGRTRTSPFMPARRSACRRSGRRCSGAAPTGSGTACGSSTTSPSTPDGRRRLGRLAAYVRDKRIPLEMAPTSNVQTGAADVDRGPPDRAADVLRFRVTVNTDNRLMSGCSMTSEMTALARLSATAGTSCNGSRSTR